MPPAPAAEPIPAPVATTKAIAPAPPPPAPETAAPAPSPYPSSLAGTTLAMVACTPSDAEVHDAANRFLGTTPFDLRVPANKTLQLTLRYSGYRPRTISR